MEEGSESPTTLPDLIPEVFAISSDEELEKSCLK